MTKKLLHLLMIASMLLVLAPAVMAADPAAEDVVTIEVWDMQQSDKNILEAQQKAIDQFEAANPGIKVNVTVFPIAEYRDKLLIAVQGGTPPDISTLDQIWMAQWAAADAIVPLDDYLAKSTLKREDFFPGAWDSNVWDGKVWGIPLNNDVWQELYYNKDMFEAAGLDPEKPPADWDEFLAYAEKLNNPPDQYGIAIMGMGEWITCIMNSYIHSNGGGIINPEGTEAIINQPESVAALEYLAKLNAFAPPGTGSRNEADAIPLFTSGKVAMIMAGSWQQDTFKGFPELNWGVAMNPAPAGKVFHGTLGGWNLSIYKAAKHPDEAWKYVEFLGADKEVQKTVNSLIPARLDAGKEFIDELRIGPQIIFDTVNNGVPRPLSKVYFDVSKAQADMMQEIWAGGDAQAAADNAAMVINEALMAQ